MITTIRTKMKNSTVIGISVMALVLSLSSCQDYLDVQPQDKLSGSQMYRNVYDADAAVIGVYGKFMGLAEKYVVLNEMRADLMTTTRNSSPYLKEISEHNVSADNPYASPKEYYEVIQDCNDVLKNFDLMLASKKFTQVQYDQRYADIGSIRTWVYLQLGIQFGSVPYITEPIEDLDNIKYIKNYPRLTFDELLDKLVKFTTTLTYKNPYSAANTLVINVDGYNTAKFFINKECLLGDLLLWKGNYNEAAMHYKTVMETSSVGSTDTEKFDNYRVKFAEVATNADLAVGYLRYSEQDATALINNNTQGWRSMFVRDPDVLWNTEWIWSLPFDINFAPKNPFLNLFDNRYGAYLAKPSQQAISLWNSNKQRNGFPYDARGQKFSYNEINGDQVIMKYSYGLNFTSQNQVEIPKTSGRWFLYRAAKLHLRYAEAANRDKKHRIADAILNFGIKSAFDVPGTTDVTNIQKTKDAFPYDFDARMGDYPFYRGNWHRGAGIRGRAFVQRAPVVGDSLISIENNIIDEDALELAYEGNRWEDLVRIGLRRKDPAFLADKVFNKLSKEGNSQASAVRAKLMNVDNWYLPFTWK
jgi:hypothetical protein